MLGINICLRQLFLKVVCYSRDVRASLVHAIIIYISMVGTCRNAYWRFSVLRIIRSFVLFVFGYSKLYYERFFEIGRLVKIMLFWLILCLLAHHKATAQPFFARFIGFCRQLSAALLLSYLEIICFVLNEYACVNWDT